MGNFLKIDLQKTVTTKLKHHCARYEIPDQVVTDNGHQFSGHELVPLQDSDVSQIILLVLTTAGQIAK